MPSRKSLVPQVFVRTWVAVPSRELLENLSLETKSAELRKAMEATKSVASRKKLAKRLRVIESLRDSGADHLGTSASPTEQSG